MLWWMLHAKHAFELNPQARGYPSATRPREEQNNFSAQVGHLPSPIFFLLATNE
jgi:hypothetical protein